MNVVKTSDRTHEDTASVSLESSHAWSSTGGFLRTAGFAECQPGSEVSSPWYSCPLEPMKLHPDPLGQWEEF